uniref:Integrator complex subunit 5 C-terminal domain-containing protein n=1 Tax=Megaselia scalaris TaxID=36166 RepID=T1GJ15_MEGSC
MVEIVDVLNSINFLNDENILTASNISRLPNLIVKFFFCAMHIENQNLRLNSLEKATNLLKYLCNKSKMYRQSCQRNLLEKGIFTYGYLFGCYDESDSMDFGTKQEESLLEQNRKQIGANTHRSVLHAGVIGDGLKKRPLDSFGMQPNNELQNLFLKAITSCCIDIEKPSSSDGFMTLSLLLVEFISTDVMYNGLPFPEDEFTKSTVERDLLIKRAFLLSPMLWSILSLLAQYRPALCLSSVLLRAICSTCLLHWKAKNVNKIKILPKTDETLECTTKLLQVMSMGQLLPPPLSNLHYIIGYFDSMRYDLIYLILKECVWNYLKDHVPSPALFQNDKNVLNWRNPSTNKVPVHYTNILKNLMQKKIHIFRSNYFNMFVMSDNTNDN